MLASAFARPLAALVLTALPLAAQAAVVPLNGTGTLTWAYLRTAASPDPATPNPAGVNTYALGVPGAYDYSLGLTAAQAGGTIPGSPSPGYGFYVAYLFEVGRPEGAVANSITSTIDLGTLLGISNLQARIYGAAQPTPVPIVGVPPVGPVFASWGTTVNAGGGTLGEVAIIDPVTLGPGTYVLEIRGTVTGTSAGSFGGTLNMTPVPLPAAAWLLLGGLVPLVALRRRAR